jgi:hypothetical protein
MTTDNSNGLARVTPSAIIPRTIDEVARLAKMAAASGLAKTTSPEAAGMLICAGLEIGLTPMQALLGMHMIEGRPTLAADTIVALIVRRTDVCEYWRSIESTPERHTIETKRRGEEFQPVRRTWTLDDAKRAGLTGKTIWQRYPVDMLRHRCATSLAREVFPDIIAGMAYTREEISDGLHNGDDEPQPAVNLADPNGSFVRPAIDAQPSPLQLPRDNGNGPSGAPLPAAEAPIVEAPPVALPLSDRDHRAMLAELTSATDLAALRAAWKGMADDEKRGTEEQRAALLDAATKRKAVFAEEARLREERKAAADAEPPNDDGPAKPPRGPRKARTPVAPADATGGGAEGADGPVDAPGARSSSGHPMTTRAERRAHLATLPLAETVRLSWRHRAAMPPPGYREDCALRVCALTHGFGVEDALAYLDAAPLRVVAPQPKTRAA